MQALFFEKNIFLYVTFQLKKQPKIAAILFFFCLILREERIFRQLQLFKNPIKINVIPPNEVRSRDLQIILMLLLSDQK